MTNQVLIKQALNGNQHAFSMLFYQWQNPLFNFCMRYIGDHDTAKDIVQKVFLKVYQKLQSLDDHSKFSSWIYRMTRNLCLDELKRKKFESIENHENLNKTVSQEESVIEGEIADMLKNALQKIPEDQREVIVFKTYHELKFIEIADILGISVNTVKSRMYLGLKALRAHVGNLEEYNNEM